MIYNLILSGGYGLRLWPLSQKDYPKQFIQLYDSLSLFQNTVMRNIVNPIIITNANYCDVVKEQLLEIDTKYRSLILETEKLGTALSIAIAALTVDCNDTILVSPSDLYISNINVYRNVVHAAIKYLIYNKEAFVLFAVKASEYNAEYGYMHLTPVGKDYYNLEEFIEKPEVIDYQKYFWNSGIFLCKAGSYLSQLKKSALHIYYHAVNLLKNSSRNYDGDICIAKPISYMGDNSVDKVIMERLQDAVALAPNFGWDDLGSWPSLCKYIYHKRKIVQVYKRLKSNNIIMQEVVKDKLVLIMVADCIFFICCEILNLERDGDIDRVWGKYKVLYHENNISIKHLMINANQEISLQKHKHRSENWLILSGRGNAIIDDKHHHIKKSSTLHIPVDCIHQVKNGEEDKVLHAIELQQGNIL